MELSRLIEEVRRIMYVRNIDPAIREALVEIVQNAWSNVKEAEG